MQKNTTSSSKIVGVNVSTDSKKGFMIFSFKGSLLRCNHTSIFPIEKRENN